MTFAAYSLEIEGFINPDAGANRRLQVADSAIASARVLHQNRAALIHYPRGR
jgi:hypothetical protein